MGMLEIILSETVKSTLKDAAKKQTGEIRRNFMAKVTEDPDQIQPWNPLSHLVDRKREAVCLLHVQEHLLLWPPRAARLPKISTAVGRFRPLVHEGFVKPDPLMSHRCSGNCWNQVFDGWRVQDRLKKKQSSVFAQRRRSRALQFVLSGEYGVK